MKLLVMIGALLPVAAAQQGSSPDALSDAASEMAAQRRYDEAAALWKKALTAAPSHFPSLFNLGFLNYSNEQYAEAEPLLARAARVRPGDFNTQYVLGSTLVRLGKREEGLVRWRSALALQPGNAKLMQIMAVEYNNGHYYREACAMGRKAVGAAAGAAEAYYIAIKACQDAADGAAFELAAEAAKRFPGAARANFEYGFQLQRAGRTAESVPYLKKAMEADSTYEEPLYFYGNMLLQEEQFDEAAQHLRAALRIRPDYVAACVALAKALAATSKDGEAVAVLEDCAAKSPEHPQPHLVLSQIYFKLGDEKRAAAEKEISLRLRRNNPGIMEAGQSRPFSVPGSGGAAGK